MQRRVGPDFVGYRGRLQYIADALKLFIKGALVPSESNKFWFVCIPAFTLAVSYSFWLNAVWGPSISIFELEYNLIYSSIFSALFTFCIILTGFFSRNKYALLAAVRAGLGMLNLELFLGLFFLALIVLGESFSILAYVNFQEIYWLIIALFTVIGLIAITFLLEVNRTPFDLSEAESELVAGYTTEYGGFLFGVYYLGEYLHLFFFSLLISSLILGGWELPRFFFIFFYTYFDTKVSLFSGDMSDLVYNFDEIFLNNHIYFGLIFYYYCDFIFEILTNFYEVYFVIIKSYVQHDLYYDFEITIYIYEICAYYIFGDFIETMKDLYEIQKAFYF
jgi:NADH:ubiquinone oxidoreductase subunit H